MALGASYEDAAAKLPDRKWETGSYPDVPETMIGLMAQEITYLLAREGVLSAWVTPCECFRDHEHQAWMYTYRNVIAQPRLAHIERHTRNGRAILGVPSLNFKDYQHWVYVEEGMLYDPAPVKEGVQRYPQGAHLEICEAILIW